MSTHAGTRQHKWQLEVPLKVHSGALLCTHGLQPVAGRHHDGQAWVPPRQLEATKYHPFSAALLRRRVLVQFHNGSSTEALIPGGEAIADSDFGALATALKRQGLGGIARVHVIGLTEG